MSLKLKAYSALEAVTSRALLWKLGRFLYQGARRDLVNQPDVNGEYALFGWMGRHWREGNEPLVFLDVGANFGCWSAQLLGELGEARKRTTVIAFEPAPMQAERATATLAEVAPPAMVHVRREAVAERSGTVNFAVTGNTTGNSGIAVKDTAPGQISEIRCVTLDEAAAECPAIQMVKVDTEGNDYNVIAGAARLLAERRIGILQFEYNVRWIDFRRTLRDVFELIDGTGYAIGMLHQSGVDLHDEWHFELERFFESNWLLVRKDLIGCLPAKAFEIGRGNVPQLRNRH